MNGYQRICTALGGGFPDRVPVMLHMFMMAARDSGMSMRQYRSSPEAIARTLGDSVERYGYDGIVVDVDTATLAGALGVPVEFPDDTPARTTEGLLPCLEAARDLAPPDISRDERIQIWLQAVRLLKTRFGDEIYIRGNCDQAPFSLAGMVRSPAEWMIDIMDPQNEETAFLLLEHCFTAAAQFLALMKEAGAHMLSNGDSPAGPDLVSPRIYRKFALPYEKRLADTAHSLGLPWMLHVCGKTNLILEDLVSSGGDAFELDWKTDVYMARDVFGGRAVFVGNIDPNGVLALGTLGQVREKTLELLEVFSAVPRFILNAGCAIPSTTPPENLREMINLAREFQRASRGARPVPGR